MNNSTSNPQVILLDFDGTVISRREMELSDAALSYAREESNRVDSAYAIVDGRIHFFRYGTRIFPPGEAQEFKAA